MNRHLLTMTLAFLIVLDGCSAFGPDRSAPKMAMPAHYSARSEAETLTAADGVSQRLSADSVPMPEWWKVYQCADLDALVAEGLAHSPSLAAARSTLTAARESDNRLTTRPIC